MKYMDTKNIIILVLLIGCLVFGYINLFRGDKLYEYKVEELQKENATLLKERDSIKGDIKTANKFYVLQTLDGENFRVLVPWSNSSQLGIPYHYI